MCAGAGALLGALRASGRDHIAVALLMIGKNNLLSTSLLSFFVYEKISSYNTYKGTGSGGNVKGTGSIDVRKKEL